MDVIRNAQGKKGIIDPDGNWVPIKHVGVTESLHQGQLDDWGKKFRAAKKSRHEQNKQRRAEENRQRSARRGAAK